MRQQSLVRKYAKALLQLTFQQDESNAIASGKSLNEAHKLAHRKQQRRRSWFEQRARYYHELPDA